MLFRAWFIDCKRTSDDTDTTLYLQWNTGGDVRIGNTSAQVAIATLKDPAFNLNVGGSSQFEIIRASNYLFVPTGSIYVNSAMKMYQRADAFNSFNIITSQQINFSLQSNKEADPTTGSIALQINGATNIVMNRPVLNNQTIYSLGDITTEGNLLAQGTLTSQGNFSLQGQLLFQHSSAIYEVLNGSDYDLLVWNGDTDRSIIFRIGAIGSTPQVKLTNSNVNLLGHLDITHSTVSTSERVKIDNNDADGLIFLSINGANICEVSSTGLHVNGASTETSDKRLKENIKEIDVKKCVDAVKYIKPKTYNYKGNDRKCVGYVADDFLTKKMPDEWDNIIYKSEDDYLRMDYGKTTPIIWSALQYALNKIEKLEKEVKALKGKKKSDSD